MQPQDEISELRLSLDKNVAHTHSTERCYKRQSPHKFAGSSRFVSKGKVSEALLFKRSGKGKGEMGNGKDGKSASGKGSTPQCYFCLEWGHIKAHCPGFLRLAKNPEYTKIRSTLLMDHQIYCYDLLEDTVGCEVYQHCLQESCTYDTCESPVEMHLMQDSTNSFISDGMWDLVEEVKQWQASAHPPLTKDMFLQQTFGREEKWTRASIWISRATSNAMV